MKESRIRPARPSDAKGILEIYAPYVINTIYSLEFTVPSEVEIAGRIESTLKELPWLVYEPGDDNEGTEDVVVGGYAYAVKHASRVGYQWTVETAVYVSPLHRGQGIATALYQELFRILAQLGYYKAVARISGANEGSEKFHKKVGFKLFGYWKNAGNKFGNWVDIQFYDIELQPLIKDPESPGRFVDFEVIPTVQNVVKWGQ
jgi:L-amino acid N-acyltransferase YncA